MAGYKIAFDNSNNKVCVPCTLSNCKVCFEASTVDNMPLRQAIVNNEINNLADFNNLKTTKNYVEYCNICNDPFILNKQLKCEDCSSITNCGTCIYKDSVSKVEVKVFATDTYYMAFNSLMTNLNVATIQKMCYSCTAGSTPAINLLSCETCNTNCLSCHYTNFIIGTKDFISQFPQTGTNFIKLCTSCNSQTALNHNLVNCDPCGITNCQTCLTKHINSGNYIYSYINLISNPDSEFQIQCIQCADNMGINYGNTTCSACPSGCKRCQNFDNSGMKCQQCQTGYVLNLNTRACSANTAYNSICYGGYPSPKTPTDSNSFLCLFCIASRSLSSTTSAICNDCPPQCDTCYTQYLGSNITSLLISTPWNILNTQYKGLYVSSTDDTTYCTACKTGYYLNAQKCTACAEFCAACSSNSGNIICTSCKTEIPEMFTLSTKFTSLARDVYVYLSLKNLYIQQNYVVSFSLFAGVNSLVSQYNYSLPAIFSQSNGAAQGTCVPCMYGCQGCFTPNNLQPSPSSTSQTLMYQSICYQCQTGLVLDPVLGKCKPSCANSPSNYCRTSKTINIQLDCNQALSLQYDFEKDIMFIKNFLDIPIALSQFLTSTGITFYNQMAIQTVTININIVPTSSCQYSGKGSFSVSGNLLQNIPTVTSVFVNWKSTVSGTNVALNGLQTLSFDSITQLSLQDITFDFSSVDPITIQTPIYGITFSNVKAVSFANIIVIGLPPFSNSGPPPNNVQTKNYYSLSISFLNVRTFTINKMTIQDIKLKSYADYSEIDTPAQVGGIFNINFETNFTSCILYVSNLTLSNSEISETSFILTNLQTGSITFSYLIVQNSNFKASTIVNFFTNTGTKATSFSYVQILNCKFDQSLIIYGNNLATSSSIFNITLFKNNLGGPLTGRQASESAIALDYISVNYANITNNTFNNLGLFANTLEYEDSKPFFSIFGLTMSQTFFVNGSTPLIVSSVEKDTGKYQGAQFQLISSLVSVVERHPIDDSLVLFGFTNINKILFQNLTIEYVDKVRFLEINNAQEVKFINVTIKNSKQTFVTETTCFINIQNVEGISFDTLNVNSLYLRNSFFCGSIKVSQNSSSTIYKGIMPFKNIFLSSISFVSLLSTPQQMFSLTSIDPTTGYFFTNVSLKDISIVQSSYTNSFAFLNLQLITPSLLASLTDIHVTNCFSPIIKFSNGTFNLFNSSFEKIRNYTSDSSIMQNAIFELGSIANVNLTNNSFTSIVSQSNLLGKISLQLDSGTFFVLNMRISTGTNYFNSGLFYITSISNSGNLKIVWNSIFIVSFSHFQDNFLFTANSGLVVDLSIQNSSFKDIFSYFGTFISKQNYSSINLQNIEFKNVSSAQVETMTLFADVGMFQGNSTSVNITNLSYTNSTLSIPFLNFQFIGKMFYFHLINIQTNKFVHTPALVIRNALNVDFGNVYFGENNLTYLQFIPVNPSSRILQFQSSQLEADISIFSSPAYTAAIVFDLATQILMNATSFRNIKCANCLGGIMLKSSSFNISNSEFLNSSSKYGPGLSNYLCNGRPYLNYISNSVFSGNVAQDSGGGIMSLYSNLNVLSAIFNNNTAGYLGGGIYSYTKSGLSTEQIILLNATFQNNTASIGAALSSFGRNITYFSGSNVQYQNNTALIYGSNEGSVPKKIIISFNNKSYENNSLTLTSFRSGNSFDSKMMIYVQDEFGELTPVLYNKSIMTAVISGNNSLYLNDLPSVNFTFTNGVYNLSGIKIRSTPEFNHQITIQVPFLKTMDENGFMNESYFYTFYVKMRNCYLGEILKDTGECQFCDNGTYSFNIKDLSCRTCKANMICHNGNNTEIASGYWRLNNLSDSFEPCVNKIGNCLQSPDNLTCAIGHIGALCESCDLYKTFWNESYTVSSAFSCFSCSQIGLNAVKLVGIMLLNLITMSWSVRGMLMQAQNQIKLKTLKLFTYYRLIAEKENSSSIYIKILLNYMSILAILKQMKISGDLMDAIGYVPANVGNPIEQSSFSIDCYLASIFSYPPIMYLRLVVSLLTPVFYYVVFIIIYKLISLCKLCKFKIYASYSAAIFIVLYSQPNLINQCILLLSCRQILGVNYIAANVAYQCYSFEHILMMLFLVLPATIIWFFVLPGVILLKLHRMRDQLDNYMVVYKFGFIYSEYKQKIYYWEYVKMYQRLLFVIILNFFESYVKEKAVLVCLSLIIYLIILNVSRPYKNDILNKVDSLSAIICLISILFGIFIYNNPILVMVFVCYGFLFLVNLCFVIFAFSKIVFSFTVDFQETLQKTLPYYENRFPKLVKLLKIHKSTELGRSLWKRARLVVSKHLYLKQKEKLQRSKLDDEELNTEESKAFLVKHVHPTMNQNKTLNDFLEINSSVSQNEKIKEEFHLKNNTKNYIPIFLGNEGKGTKKLNLENKDNIN